MQKSGSWVIIEAEGCRLIRFTARVIAEEAEVGQDMEDGTKVGQRSDSGVAQAQGSPEGATRPRAAAADPGKVGRSRRPQPLLPGAHPELPPTAQRLLDAAHRLLVRSGYNSLTVEAIGKEAGENKALIRYYFGSKNGLLIALTDSLIMQTLGHTRRRLSGLSDARDRATVVIDTMQDILADEASYRLLFDLLPRLLENPSMARQLADLYRGYREINARALWGDLPGEPTQVIREVAAMTVALTDGLAVQVLAEPGSIDVRSALATWRAFVEGVLASAQPISIPSAASVSPDGAPVSLSQPIASK